MTMRPRFWSTKLLAVVLASALAGISLWYWTHEKSEHASRQQQLFLLSAERVAFGIAHQIAHVQALIHSAQGYHRGANGLPDQAFARHLQTLGSPATTPAVQSITLVQRTALNDAPDKDALLRSAESGEITLSAHPIAGPDARAANRFSMVGPLYAQGTDLSNASQRRAGLVGWVRVQLRAQKLLEPVEQQLPHGLALALYDAAGALVYGVPPAAAPLPTQADDGANTLHAQSRPLELGASTWAVLTYPLPSFLLQHDPEDPFWILVVGGITSLLVGTLAWLLGDSRGHALQQASEATQNLQDTNSALRGILSAMPDLMFALDEQGRYLEYWSPRQELLAAPPKYFIGKLLHEVLPPEVVAVCQTVMQECTETGFSTGHQIQLQIQGQPKWFELSASRTVTAQDQPRFILLSRDITERKRVEQDLREHEQQLILALKGGDMGFWDWDFAGGHMRANERWFTMLGLDPHTTSISLDLWHSLVHPADLHKLDTLLHSVILHPQGKEFNTEIRARHADGHLVWIQDKGAVFTRDADGKPLRVVGTHMDITARKLDEEKLRLSEYAFKSITQGIVITDLAGDIQVVNDAFCTISGYTRSDILGINCRMLQGPQTDRATVARLRRCLETLAHFSSEILNYKKNGEPFWNDLEIAPVFNADNEPSHFVGVLKDISDKKRTELTMQADREAIRNNETQLRVLSRKVLDAQETERRRVAHELHDELGQSLTAIKINLQSQQARAGTPPTAIDLENVRIVEDTLQQVRRLALALRPSMLDDLGLAPALAWLAKSAAVNRDMAVNFQHTMDRARLPHAVETACFRIVQESLTNVRRHAHASQVDIHLHVAAHALRLTVTDNGAGFETPAPNTLLTSASLGLLGMRERAAAIGGTITIHSVPGQGSTIALQCTLTEQEPPTT